MDDFDRLTTAYEARRSGSVASRMAVLIELGQLHDRRAVGVLLNVLGDRREATDVRIHVLKQLRQASGVVRPEDREQVATTVRDVLLDASNTEVRVQAALILGELTEMGGVLATLSLICASEHESIDLRYAAFTSLERAGSTPECVARLRELSSDETLGPSARSVLSAWRLG